MGVENLNNSVSKGESNSRALAPSSTSEVRTSELIKCFLDCKGPIFRCIYVVCSACRRLAVENCFILLRGLQHWVSTSMGFGGSVQDVSCAYKTFHRIFATHMDPIIPCDAVKDELPVLASHVLLPVKLPVECIHPCRQLRHLPLLGFSSISNAPRQYSYIFRSSINLTVPSLIHAPAQLGYHKHQFSSCPPAVPPSYSL
jgi:hypothetical protein